MNTLELNKIAGSILLVLMAIQVIGILGDALVSPRGHGAAVDIKSSPVTIEAQKPKPTEPVLPLLASANVAKGESISKKCLACHDFKKGGPNKIGPNLYGVVGRPIASHGGFDYSSAMKQYAEKHGKWTYELLNRLVHDPRKDVPGTKMTFAGLDKVQERADLVAFLRSLADTPAALPTADEIKAVQQAAEAEKAPAEAKPAEAKPGDAKPAAPAAPRK
jgi:cytochrome c